MNTMNITNKTDGRLQQRLWQVAFRVMQKNILSYSTFIIHSLIPDPEKGTKKGKCRNKKMQKRKKKEKYKNGKCKNLRIFKQS